VGRCIALLFHDRGTRRWVSGQQHAPATLYPHERPGNHFTGGWVGARAGLENLVTTGIRSRTVQSVAQSPYRLSYRAHRFEPITRQILATSSQFEFVQRGRLRVLGLRESFVAQILNYQFHSSRGIPFSFSRNRRRYTP